MTAKYLGRNDGVEIRPIRVDDATEFRDIRLQALQMHPEAFCADHEENLAYPLESWVERARANTGTGDGVIYAAAASQLLAMCGIRRNSGPKICHSGVIWGVYARLDQRSQIASALVSACLDWARDQGLRTVMLAVATTNTSAIRTYSRLGFTVYGVEPEVIYANSMYYDELLMVRRL